MRFLPFLVLFALILSGCTDRERVPVMGQWLGGFYTEKGQAFKGYLQLYRTKDKFKLRLASKEQAMDMEGTWAIEKQRVILSVTDIKFDNPTEEDQKALGMRIITPDEVRDAFKQRITLDLDSAGEKLTGLTMSLGPLSGKHEFTKDEVTRNTKQALEGIKGAGK